MRGGFQEREWGSIAGSPEKLAVVYSLFGLLAVVGFEMVLVRVLGDTAGVHYLQAAAGSLGVLTTAGFIYLLSVRNRASVDRKQREVDQARHVLDVIHRLLRHNIRNDITVIKGYSTEAGEHTEDPHVASCCTEVNETADELLTHVQKARLLKETVTGETSLARFELRDVLAECSESIRHVHPTAHLVIDTPGATEPSEPSETPEPSESPKGPERSETPTIVANEHFPIALTELVDNAIRHNRSEPSRVRVDVDPYPDGKPVVVVRISDNGPGIPRDERLILGSVEETPLRHSSGLGLWFVYWVLEESGGSIDFETSGEGTVVTLELPTTTYPPDTQDTLQSIWNFLR